MNRNQARAALMAASIGSRDAMYMLNEAETHGASIPRNCKRVLFNEAANGPNGFIIEPVCHAGCPHDPSPPPWRAPVYGPSDDPEIVGRNTPRDPDDPGEGHSPYGFAANH